MVLEILFKAKDIEYHPFEMFIYSFLVSLISSIIAVIIFSSYASITFTFLITLTLFPVMHKILSHHAEEEERSYNTIPFRERYRNIIQIYGMFFLGIVVGVTTIMALYPTDITKTLFEEQVNTINAIRGDNLAIDGNFHNKIGTFNEILFNNIKVLFIAFMMSFFFGTGALFILSWNATVVGVFISLYAKDLAHTYGKNIFLAHLSAFLSISLHGIPEIISYFLGGIAGAILSYGILRGNDRKIIIIDAIKTFIIANLIVVGAAFIEVFISGSF